MFSFKDVRFFCICLISDYKKTSLNTSMVIFEKFLKSLENTWKGKKIEESGKF
jgi:hypothetical protein